MPTNPRSHVAAAEHVVRHLCRRYAAIGRVAHGFRGLAPTAKLSRRYAAESAMIALVDGCRFVDSFNQSVCTHHAAAFAIRCDRLLNQVLDADRKVARRLCVGLHSFVAFLLKPLMTARELATIIVQSAWRSFKQLRSS
jgi:hypothetical protein